MKEEKVNALFKEEMKGFEINVDDIQPSTELFNTIEKAIIKMRNEYFIDKLEVVLNDNLIESKDKHSGYRTIFGCRVSYDNLPNDVSFIVREDTKPTYEELQERIDKAIEYTKRFINGKTSRIDEWKNVELVLENIVNILEGKDE